MALAELYAGGTSDWTADETNPGYVRYKFSDLTILVPFHLLVDFPQSELLAELINLGNWLRVGSASTVCLSGSSTFLGSLPFAGDLDFCEYIRIEDLGTFDGLAALTERADATFVCYEIRVGSTSWERPWLDKEHRSASAFAEVVNALTSKNRHGKVDAIVVGRNLRALAASNVLIWLSSEEGGASDRSFALQESPFSMSDILWIPRRLAKPDSVGAYIIFLRGQIDHYRRDNPVKAVKRALSLSLLMMLDEHAKVLRALLRRTIALRRDAVRQREKLLSAVKDHPDPEVRALEPAISGSVKDFMAQDKPATQKVLRAANKRFERSAAVLITQLTSEVDEMIGLA